MFFLFANNHLDAQFFFMYVNFYSLHVSGSHMPIISRINCISTTSGICHSVQMTVWCAGLDETAVSSKTCTPNGHLYRVTYTRSRIDTINPLNAELNPICHLLALLGVHHFLHVSRIRVKSLNLRLLKLYIYIYIYIYTYMEHLLLMFLDHTQRRSTVDRTPLDE